LSFVFLKQKVETAWLRVRDEKPRILLLN